MKDLNSRTDTAKLKPQGTSTIGRKDQLEYLAKLFDLEVQFTDFPKVGLKTPIIVSPSCNFAKRRRCVTKKAADICKLDLVLI